MKLLAQSRLEVLVKGINEDLRSKVPVINQGGCGIFASLMYKELTRLGYKPEIVILDRWGDLSTKKETLNNVRNNQKVKKQLVEETSFSHCLVRVGGIVFDGLEVGNNVRDVYSAPEVGNYSIEELDLAIKVASWNDTYHRRRNITVIRTIKRNITRVYANSN